MDDANLESEVACTSIFPFLHSFTNFTVSTLFPSVSAGYDDPANWQCGAALLSLLW